MRAGDLLTNGGFLAGSQDFPLDGRATILPV